MIWWFYYHFPLQACIDIYIHANDRAESEEFVHRPSLGNRLMYRESMALDVWKFFVSKYEFSTVGHAQSSTQALILAIKEDVKNYSVW